MKAINYKGDEVTLPKLGEKVYRDGCPFTVTEVAPHPNPYIVASITLRGESGSVEVGYYDYLLHAKA